MYKTWISLIEVLSLSDRKKPNIFTVACSL